MSVHATPDVPDDVQRVINNDTKATSRERIRKLLRDAYYAGPIPKGSSPERSTGANTSSPGSDLRRSRDGALWNLTQKQENALIQTAKDLTLIDTHQGEVFTTPRGVEILSVLDRCDECDDQRVPHYDERTVQISRYSTGKNHSLTTKCESCDDGAASWDRDEFPPTHAGTDDAERIVRSIQHADLYGVGVGEWMEPEHRALQDFIATVKENYHTDFDSYLTRYSTPNRLPGGGDALREIFNNYSADVCRDFAGLLLDTYYGACLSDVEQGIVGHVAAGCPEARDPGDTDHHAADVLEPLAVIEDDSWEATVRFEATGEYVTISGNADRTREGAEYKTNSDCRLILSSPSIGRVNAYPMPNEYHPHDTGDVATVVSFTIVDEPAYDGTSRVEQAFSSVQRAVSTETRAFRMRQDVKTAFSKVVKGRPVNDSRFGPSTKHDLNNAELVQLARKVDAWLPEEVERPELLERYASRELQ